MMNKLRFLVTTGVVTLLSVALVMPAIADVREDVTTLMERVRNGKVPNDSAINSAPPLEVLDELNRYRKDPDEEVRRRALRFIGDIARRSGQAPLMQEAVLQLLDAVTHDNSSAIARSVGEKLLLFPRSAFTEKARQSVHQLLMAQDPDPEILRLAGIAEDQGGKLRLKEWAKEPINTADRGWWFSRSWAAHLALARMGDPAEIKFCIDTVESTKDDRTRIITLLKDLDYIRQPATVEVLIRYLLSDQILPGQPPDVPDMLHADYALRLVPLSIEGFPQYKLAFDENGNWITWLSVARKWVNEHRNNLKIKR